MSRSATQSPEGSALPETSDSDSRVRFHAYDDVESFYGYVPGGYHPVAIGDRLGGHYKVLNKLGHGGYSTVWLARDERLQRLVAVKVCVANMSPRESEILSLLRDLPVANGDGANSVLGRDVIHTLLDTFHVTGPHGTHMCLVTEVTGCSVIQAKHNVCYAPMMLPAARAIAAQLVLGVAYLHDNGFVHGDLHLGNVLLRLPQESHLWSDEELLEHCGEPELEKLQTFDDKPIPPGVPHVVTMPIWFPVERVNKLPLSGARIVLADFGEAHRPLQESKFVSCAPEYCRPPEARFEPTKPKSFSSDIWTLACSVWGTLAWTPLFSMYWPTEDGVTSLQVEALGKLPDEWWENWEARSKYYTEDGQPLRTDNDPVRTLHSLFSDAMQEGRLRHKETMGFEERKALFAMLQSMLVYRPEQRSSVKEVLSSEWMIKYAMPDYERMCTGASNTVGGWKGTSSRLALIRPEMIPTERRISPPAF
ncbi:protein kinase domain protein [Beauveria brongniartii RCEF 3172]|uniref:non-specific serine/threonine protein kinase n=1 Tax=Beauveria brongniartii RCEF 3172 TaxID=1081107 RepID=A0A167GE84_9HYPO|nr:protein kinase domain protein [Beauveria brongniartii RCEF 3172]